MKTTTHVSIQAALVAALGFIATNGDKISAVVPVKYQPYLMLVIGLSSAILGWYNHYFNPDGTGAKTAWTPPTPPPK